MATADPTAPTVAHPFVLHVPGSRETGRPALRREVASLDEDVTVYQSARDESGEGASTFAPGEVTGPGGGRWRVSYNGRVQPKVPA
ncbi:MAG: hypothetical protein ACP5P4_02490 [Steroidobacteraceae bacterium]